MTPQPVRVRDALLLVAALVLAAVAVIGTAWTFGTFLLWVMGDDLAALAGLLEAEWYNGNMDEPAYLRLNADLGGIVAKYRQLVLWASVAPDDRAPDFGLQEITRGVGSNSAKSGAS